MTHTYIAGRTIQTTDTHGHGLRERERERETDDGQGGGRVFVIWTQLTGHIRYVTLRRIMLLTTCPGVDASCDVLALARSGSRTIRYVDTGPA